MPEINIGDLVYLKTNVEQLPRICTAYTTRLSGIVYEFACGSNSTWHYNIEISTEKTDKQNLVKGLGK